MNREVLIEAIENPTDDAINALLDEQGTTFWVDWREEEPSIVEYCAEVIGSDALTSELVDVDDGVEMYIIYKGQRSKVPLTMSGEDRHIALVALNRAMGDDFEIRMCVDSNGSDTLAFTPLPGALWRELEAKYGGKVAERFYRLQDKPNVFTDPLPF